MSIITARKLLLKLAETNEDGDAIRSIVHKYMFRAPPIRRARSARKMSNDLKMRILAFADQNPDMDMQTIGELFDVNSGRVSEVLNNK